MVAFGGKLLLAMYGSHSGASRVSAVWRLSAFWRVRYRRFHCIYVCSLLLMTCTEEKHRRRKDINIGTADHSKIK